MKISKIFFFSIICLNFYNFASACFKCSIVEVYDVTKHKAYETLQKNDPKIQCLCGRNTLKYENKYYVINAYPVNFDKAANNYIQFADLINTNENHFKQDCVNMFEAISLLGDLKLAVPKRKSEKTYVTTYTNDKCSGLALYDSVNLNTINFYKEKWLRQLKSKSVFLNKINIQINIKANNFNTLQELKQASLDAIKPLKEYCDNLVLQFAKELFKYIRHFNKEAPDINGCEKLENLPINNKEYKSVFEKFQQYNIVEVFTDNKNTVNKYLHTEYMLYYNLILNDKQVAWPVHFVSYFRMCSSCEELWAARTPCEENKHNTVCFFKIGKQNKNDENINTSFLQIASPNSNKK